MTHLPRTIIIWLFCIFILLCAIVAGAAIGEIAIPFSSFLKTIANHLFDSGYEVDIFHSRVIWLWRLPRAVVGACCGAGLAMCGVILQALLRNPLAEPYLLGISSGAGTGAALVTAFGMNLSILSLSTGALIGGLLSFFFVVFLAYHSGRNATAIILAGIASAMLFNALTALILMIFTPLEGRSNIFAWMIDPSYTDQIVTFTFPHIGNVGVNAEDIEDLTPAQRSGAVGAIFKADITHPSNYRAAEGLDKWLSQRGIIGLCGIDTRALTSLIREKGLANAVIAHDKNGVFDVEALKERARKWSGLVGLDLAKDVTEGQSSEWDETPWVWNEGYGHEKTKDIHIVAVDYGVKRNILRLLAGLEARVTVVPAKTTAEEILALNPDGIFLSNGPGDRSASD